ncbi:MAG: hypothetical protein LBL08_01585 [Candidatus Nomurabacteria bacterium]|jgi:hypothetical protein|nr:hypothetical protein [Candidatus Nomurabacteria bacterium]
MSEFSFVWFFIGMAIVAVGALILRYYNKLAEITSVGNYSRWQLTGFIIIGAGFLVAMNVHVFILNLIVQSIISGY